VIIVVLPERRTLTDSFRAIAPAAATATSPPPPVALALRLASVDGAVFAARLFGEIVGRQLANFVCSMVAGRVGDLFGMMWLFFGMMRLCVYAAAIASAAASPAPPPASATFRVLGGNLRC